MGTFPENTSNHPDHQLPSVARTPFVLRTRTAFGFADRPLGTAKLPIRFGLNLWFTLSSSLIPAVVGWNAFNNFQDGTSNQEGKEGKE